MFNIDLWLASAAMAGALFAGGSSAGDAVDAVAAAPDEFTVLLENDAVRVIEYEIRPGQQEPWHTHPPKVSYVLAGGKLRVRLIDGTSFDVTETAGETSWMAALGPHHAENIGATPVRILLIEVKSAAAAASGTEPSLVGAWRLVSMTKPDASGAAQSYWGEQTSGFLLYTADGHMAAQVYDARRPRLGVAWQSANADAALVQYAGLSTYFGTYSVDAKAHTVTHAVEGAMVPDWIGSKLVRSYQFIDANHIELRVVADNQIVVDGLVLQWERIR